MNRSIVQSVLLTAALLFSVSLSIAAYGKAAAPSEAAAGPKAVEPGAKAKKKATAPVKLVDINSASKAELKKLPLLNDVQVDRIIEGRPYLSKANLVTHNIIPRGIYEQIKDQIVAVQKKEAKKK